MKLNLSIVFCLLFLSINFFSKAQEFSVRPFLQDAEPNSIFIVWETSFGEESLVEWGETQDLGNTTYGTFESSFDNAIVHTTEIDGLERFTTYYYRVVTGELVSEISSFKTPPFASDNESFRLVAMSDMQRNGVNVSAYEDVVQEGVLDYFENEFGGSLEDDLAFVMIPGDLVQNGNEYDQWKNGFFTPAEGLFNQVPVYPVLGNHDQDSPYFFTYFKLPDNGTNGFEEHWWFKDYGNLRLIGLDSNFAYDIEEQSEWLDSLLTATCSNDSIDYVFAQLHHFHKSEMSMSTFDNFTLEALQKLEQFSSDCEKLSIHFFGHNHNYSRGNSRDHKHLWINVATAGGNIHIWEDEFCQDHPEFSVTQDAWGFVTVDVVNDDDPRIEIKRVSRGDQEESLDNIITDEAVFHLEEQLVDTPTPFYPIDISIPPECVVLKASQFDSQNDLSSHGQAHWQVATEQNSFDAPVAESWRQFENWYFDEDTQAEDDLTDEAIEGLDENTNYWWRVRYRDKDLNWSDWSEEVSFSTSESQSPQNLILNGGGEEGLTYWNTIQGIVESLEAGVCNGTTPYDGEKYFCVGGLCEQTDSIAICFQNVNVMSFTDSIDEGDFQVRFGGLLSNYNGNDIPEMYLTYLDENEEEIGMSSTLSSLSSNWTLVQTTELIPAQTRSINVTLKGTHVAGSFNDSYFDAIFLELGIPDLSCDDDVSIVRQKRQTTELHIFPNPVDDRCVVTFGRLDISNSQVLVSTVHGRSVNCEMSITDDRFILSTESLINGTYFIRIVENGYVLATGKFIVLK